MQPRRQSRWQSCRFSLLSQGGGGGDGDGQTNPACDLAVWAGAPDDGKFHVLIGGKRDQPLWIGVHASFGPIYIDQIGVQLGDDPDHTSACSSMVA